MVTYKIDPSFSIPVIDVPATSKRLKELRESHNITVAQIQKLLGMENPQSIYTWENANEKYLPRLDNLVTLAKLYKVSLDELIINGNVIRLSGKTKSFYDLLAKNENSKEYIIKYTKDVYPFKKGSFINKRDDFILNDIFDK